MLTLLTCHDEFEFKAVFVKGKNNKKDFRFLIEHLKDGPYHKKGDLVLLYFHEHPFFGQDFELIETTNCVVVNESHIRFKNYNYYFLDRDVTKLQIALLKFKKKRKFFHTNELGLFTENYNPTFELNELLY